MPALIGRFPCYTCRIWSPSPARERCSLARDHCSCVASAGRLFAYDDGTGSIQTLLIDAACLCARSTSYNCRHARHTRRTRILRNSQENWSKQLNENFRKSCHLLHFNFLAISMDSFNVSGAFALASSWSSIGASTSGASTSSWNRFKARGSSP